MYGCFPKAVFSRWTILRHARCFESPACFEIHARDSSIGWTVRDQERGAAERDSDWLCERFWGEKVAENGPDFGPDFGDMPAAPIKRFSSCDPLFGPKNGPENRYPENGRCRARRSISGVVLCPIVCGLRRSLVGPSAVAEMQHARDLKPSSLNKNRPSSLLWSATSGVQEPRLSDHEVVPLCRSSTQFWLD